MPYKLNNSRIALLILLSIIPQQKQQCEWCFLNIIADQEHFRLRLLTYKRQNSKSSQHYLTKKKLKESGDVKTNPGPPRESTISYEVVKQSENRK